MQKEKENIDTIIDDIYNVILQRKKTKPLGSYVASLFDKGLDSILKKIGEEAGELIISSKNNLEKEIIHEISDLLFHIIVVLGYHEIKPNAILRELKRRFR